MTQLLQRDKAVFSYSTVNLYKPDNVYRGAPDYDRLIILYYILGFTPW